MTKAELDKVIKIISTHDEGEYKYCDTGADMDWGCRSDCTELAIKRLRRELRRSDMTAVYYFITIGILCCIAAAVVFSAVMLSRGRWK